MTENTIKPGMKIRYHGGWNGTKERCPACQFQCGYIYSGEIIERYHVWDMKTQTLVLTPDEQWTAKIETGSYVVGTPEQFELVDTTPAS
jgi:hypothetical protein